MQSLYATAAAAGRGGGGAAPSCAHAQPVVRLRKPPTPSGNQGDRTGGLSAGQGKLDQGDLNGRRLIDMATDHDNRPDAL
jgi:hypothetical protein